MANNMSGGDKLKLFIPVERRFNDKMGRELAYRDGMKLTLRVDDAFAPAIEEDSCYELRIYTDKGLAYASYFDPKEPQAIALEVQKRRFYRAEVVNVTHGFRIAVGNPIWLDKE